MFLLLWRLSFFPAALLTAVWCRRHSVKKYTLCFCSENVNVVVVTTVLDFTTSDLLSHVWILILLNGNGKLTKIDNCMIFKSSRKVLKNPCRESLGSFFMNILFFDHQGILYDIYGNTNHMTSELRIVFNIHARIIVHFVAFIVRCAGADCNCYWSPWYI